MTFTFPNFEVGTNAQVEGSRSNSNQTSKSILAAGVPGPIPLDILNVNVQTHLKMVNWSRFNQKAS